MTAAARERLPNRRTSTTFDFQCGPHRYTATVAAFPGTDKLAEIFLGNGRAGSDIDAAAKDSAVVASIALQHGVPVETIRKALLRDPQGIASSPLGVALDLIAGARHELRILPQMRHAYRRRGCLQTLRAHADAGLAIPDRTAATGGSARRRHDRLV
jgi:hypothetical protein